MTDGATRPSLIDVEHQRPEYYYSCCASVPQSWHVLGSLPCKVPSTCGLHYSLCLPVLTQLLDSNTLLGVIYLDDKAIKAVLCKIEEASPDNFKNTDLTSRVAIPESIVADLAAPKRAGRLPGGPDTSPTNSQRKSVSRSPTNNLFSLELMQTDDVSTIAAQIANQAELIYQAWKTTDLNPSELIHYHSVSSDRSSPLSSSFCSSPTSPPVSLSRTPIRNISPAPLGSSPALPRRVIDIPISTENPSNVHMQNYHHQTKEQISPQQHLQQQLSQKSLQQPQHQKHSRYQDPRQPFLQPPQSYQQLNIHQANHQHQPHASSPGRTLNASPRPYIPPDIPESIQPSTETQTVLNSSPVSSLTSGELHSHTSRALNTHHQPPPPPERSSSYAEPPHAQSQRPKDVHPDSELEDSLRELVSSFVIEDKARLAGAKISDRPKSVPPSSIQDALNRFERQMAITSRVPSDISPNHKTHTITSFASTPTTVSSLSVSPAYSSKMHSGEHNDVGHSENWNKRDTDIRSRRSISPSPVISHPGWNEPPPVNTSTWPLKNKHPTNVDRRSATNTTNSSQSQLASTLQTFNSDSPVPNPTNYITTLEAKVDSPGSTPSVPVRHKVMTVSGPTKESQPLQQTSKKTIPTDCKDFIHPYESFSKGSSPSTIPGSQTVITSRGTSTAKPKKFSVSVTVDVESKLNTDPLITNSQIPLSNVDYAKVRFKDAQQRPKTSQRLEDYKTFSSKVGSNGDGRVLQAKNRFEISPSTEEFTTVTEAPWRTIPPSPIAGGEMGATLPEVYRRKLRKLRKPSSLEPPHALAALPHPQLTDQQKAHIRERSQSPNIALGASTAVRPFLTQGSVAERVLLFEKAPTELKKATSPASALSDRRRPAFSTWRDPDEVRIKAQDVFHSPPSASRSLEILPSSTPEVAVDVGSSNFVPSHTRESHTTSSDNKENALPAPSTPPSTPISPQATSVPSRSIPSLLTSTSPVGIAGTGLSGSIPTRVPGRRGNKTPKNILIPRFYYPLGRPMPQASQDQSLNRVSLCFQEYGNRIQRDNMEPLMRACQLPLYWKAPLFIAAGGEKLGHLTEEQFLDYWGRLISSCHDSCSRFVRILSRGLKSFLLPEDFLSLVQDVVDTHPGLTFLKEATEFHSRYVHTVIARIYYCVNRSWSGRITVPELRRSNLLQVINYLEEEEDINKITDYFSYEHFYVIYCKFWELDTDHDLFIDRNDLSKHNERALSDKIIERIFSGAVTRGRMQKQDRMGYQEFVWFLISEEDKRHPTAIEYWFRCMDLDGDGFLSMYELEYFYEDQLQRMEALGIETLPFSDCICQMLDMVRPEHPERISLSDLKKCRMTPVFFDTFFNFDKYLDHEQRDPFASHRMDDDGPEISDWDRYAAVEYELLVAEEGGGDSQDDMLYGEEDDELSMGVDSVLDGSEYDQNIMDSDMHMLGGGLKKHSNISATVPNLSVDQIDMDEDYADYADADSDEYHY